MARAVRGSSLIQGWHDCSSCEALHRFLGAMCSENSLVSENGQCFLSLAPGKKQLSHSSFDSLWPQVLIDQWCP